MSAFPTEVEFGGGRLMVQGLFAEEIRRGGSRRKLSPGLVCDGDACWRSGAAGSACLCRGAVFVAPFFALSGKMYCSVLEWMLSASAAFRAPTQVLICGGAAVVEGEYQIVAAIIFSGFLPLFGCVWFCLARFSRDGTDGAHLGHTANWGGHLCCRGRTLSRGAVQRML
jgi:hypothetical protein